MEQWTAIVLAGRRPGKDAFPAAFGERYKARVPVAGEPMLARVVRTLLAAPRIARIVILTQEPDALLQGNLSWIADDERIRCLTSGDGIAKSIAAVAGGADAPWPVLITTADHALLTPADVEAFIDGSSEGDLSVGLVSRETLLARYPTNRRTWLKFSGGAYTGANLFALRGPSAAPALDLWSRAERDRKVARRLFRHFGPLLALRMATRTISLHGALRAAGRRLGVVARPVLLANADAGIDVDKAADHRLAEEILRRRATA